MPVRVDPEVLSIREVYQWMIHTIQPRPIAWVSTVDGQGRTNLAPFSFVMGVCAKPPTLLFCPVNDRFGRPKDTLRNIEETGEFVVNLVSVAECERMNRTAETLPPGESEFERFGVPQAASERVRPPRVAGVPASFECTLDRVIRVSEGPAGGNIVLGRIRLLHVRDDVLGAGGLPEAALMDLVSRAGSDVYLHGGEMMRMERPL